MNEVGLTENTILFFHLFSLYSFIVLYFAMLYILNTNLNFIKLVNKIKLIAPLIFMSVFNTLFTGILMIIINKVDISLLIIAMILLLIYLLVSDIKRYKKQKVITSYNYLAQSDFIIYSKKLYIRNITFILLFIFIWDFLK